jgi:MerR family transcriptional regulator, light-induced transcriptional regulator
MLDESLIAAQHDLGYRPDSGEVNNHPPGPTLWHADQTLRESPDMASGFGLTELKLRLSDWSAGRIAWPRRWSRDKAPAGQLTLIDPGRGPQLDLPDMLEKLVIPRLIAQHDRVPERTMAIADTSAKPTITAADVEAFARIAVDGEARDLLDFADACERRGCSVEMLYVDLLAPAARRLGEGWTDDSRNFVDVTMGLWRIQEVLRSLAVRSPPSINAGYGRRSALFAPMPGDQHNLGTLMIGECFQRAGWDCQILVGPTRSELMEALDSRAFDLAGLTVSNDCSSGSLASMVHAMRAVSSNPRIRILLGGRAIDERPELVSESGADATASDAVSAVALADNLVPLMLGCFDNPL